MNYPLLPPSALLAAILVIIPLPWHWRARNIPTLSLMGWSFFLNIFYAVNIIVWNGNILDWAPVYCDITTKFRVGAQFAIPAAVFCVCRSLESIASNRAVYIDRATKQRWMIFDCVMCFLLPCVFMALHYIVQGHRYDIVEDFGCQAATYNSIPGFFIVFVPSLILAVLAMGFAGAAFYHFFRHRLAFSQHLANKSSGLTTNRYLRLMGMAVVVIIWNTSLNVYNLALNASFEVRPWTSWADVHSNWNRADKYPTALLSESYIQNELLYWWAIPVSSYIMFFFFGLGEEARKEYRKVYMWIRSRVFKLQDRPSASQSLPTYSVRLPFAQKSAMSTTTIVDSDKTSFASPTSRFHPSTLPSTPSLVALP
ncbi:pheromone A receptor-domain-containing protein [Amylostereum chailletii]|nr:pheromone A receptor-domain-containing protein [Amylostereum chailletii]